MPSPVFPELIPDPTQETEAVTGEPWVAPRTPAAESLGHSSRARSMSKPDLPFWKEHDAYHIICVLQQILGESVCAHITLPIKHRVLEAAGESCARSSRPAISKV